MARIDPATGRPRGFMRMGRHPRLDSVLFTLDVRDAAWREANRCARRAASPHHSRLRLCLRLNERPAAAKHLAVAG